MSGYKVGDIAATFPNSATPKSESGKKLQSLFNEYYNKNKNKEVHKFDQVMDKRQKNKKFLDSKDETVNESINKNGKSKKRKFHNLNDSSSNFANEPTKYKKKKIQNLDASFKNFQPTSDIIKKEDETNTTSSLISDEKCFPRNKKQKTKFGKNTASFINSFARQKQTYSATEEAQFEEKPKAYDFSNVKFKYSPFKIESKNKNNMQNNIFNESNDSGNENFENDGKDYKKLKKGKKLAKKPHQNWDKIPKPDNSTKWKEIGEQDVFNESAGANDVYFQNSEEECEKYVKDKKLSKKKIQSINDQVYNDVKSVKKVKNAEQNDVHNELNISSNKSFENDVEAHKIKKKNKKKNKKIHNKVNGDDKSAKFQNENIVSDLESESVSLKKLNKKKVKNVNSPLKQEPDVKNEDENMLSKKDSENFISLSATDETEESRTVSVGNLPATANRKMLYKLFTPFGPIENARIRGAIPIKPGIPRKVAEITESYHKNMHNLRGFVTFKERKSAMESLILNGTFFEDRHIFVDLAVPAGEKKLYDDKRSIFVGNLPFNVEEEAIWSTFSQCGLIERIRVVRDRVTGAGKGIAYIMFRNVETKEKALALEDVEIGNRTLRLKPVESSNHKRKASIHNSKSPRNSFKSKAIRMKRRQEKPNSRKTIKKMVKKEKNIHKKKQIASYFQNTLTK